MGPPASGRGTRFHRTRRTGRDPAVVPAKFRRIADEMRGVGSGILLNPIQ